MSFGGEITDNVAFGSSWEDRPHRRDHRIRRERAVYKGGVPSNRWLLPEDNVLHVHFSDKRRGNGRGLEARMRARSFWKRSTECKMAMVGLRAWLLTPHPFKVRLLIPPLWIDRSAKSWRFKPSICARAKMHGMFSIDIEECARATHRESIY